MQVAAEWAYTILTAFSNVVSGTATTKGMVLGNVDFQLSRGRVGVSV